MGALSNIIAFDFRKFEDEVIPSFREGENSNIIRSEIELLRSKSINSVSDFPNLAQIIDLFDDDLTTCKYDKCFAADSQGIYQTTRKFELPHRNCWSYEDLTILFECVVLRNCPKYFLSLGKIYQLDSIIYSNDSEVQELIQKWDKGSKVWNHGSGGFAEGISGWINPDEVKRLYQQRAKIEFRFEEYFPKNSILRSIFELLKISSDEDLGILYGNDLLIDLVPHFQYYLILKLTELRTKNFSEHPTYENVIINDFR
jgi:hypothetical protein